jgi:hypothetical protein
MCLEEETVAQIVSNFHKNGGSCLKLTLALLARLTNSCYNPLIILDKKCVMLE